VTAPVPQPGNAVGGRVAASDAPVYVGLMSGTSLDGITAAVVRFHDAPGGRPRAELLGVTQRAYAPAERERLARALEGTTAAEYCRLNFDLGAWLADAAAAAARDAGVPLASVRAVASHGQTVWHDAPHSTWQFGESAVIAERTGVPVVSDFRVRDVAAGGHGAPLVAMADVLLFAAADAWRALQNLGGIGNVTVVPPAGAGAGLRAFDTGPGVAVIDGVVRLLHPDLPYDVDGRLARAGVPVEGVASALLADPYFASPPPKSTGRELFSAAYVEAFLERCRAARPGCTPADAVATAVELTARSVGDAYHRFVAEPVGDVLVSGGGARNPALFDAVASALAPRTVRRFDEVFFDGEAKEAVAFALLGHLHLTGRPGNVPAATGAGGGRILGKLTPP
jgi:anhydro-N-acetylmuramic acid kinase